MLRTIKLYSLTGIYAFAVFWSISQSVAMKDPEKLNIFTMFAFVLVVIPAIVFFNEVLSD